MSSAKARSGRDIVDFSYSLPSDLEKAVAQDAGALGPGEFHGAALEKRSDVVEQ